MKKSAIFLTLVAAIAFTGCTSVPSHEKMQADIANYALPKAPEEGKAIVYVVRPASVGALIRFNAFVDDKEAASEMGYTRGSQYIYFNVTPGDHVVLSKAENWAETNISAKPGDVIFIQQDAQMGIIMARNSLFKIDETEGKYHVKHLSVGTIIKTSK